MIGDVGSLSAFPSDPYLGNHNYSPILCRSCAPLYYYRLAVTAAAAAARPPYASVCRAMISLLPEWKMSKVAQDVHQTRNFVKCSSCLNLCAKFDFTKTCLQKKKTTPLLCRYVRQTNACLAGIERRPETTVLRSLTLTILR